MKRLTFPEFAIKDIGLTPLTIKQALEFLPTSDFVTRIEQISKAGDSPRLSKAKREFSRHVKWLTGQNKWPWRKVWKIIQYGLHSEMNWEGKIVYYYNPTGNPEENSALLDNLFAEIDKANLEHLIDYLENKLPGNDQVESTVCRHLQHPIVYIINTHLDGDCEFFAKDHRSRVVEQDSFGMLRCSFKTVKGEIIFG